MKEHRQSFDIFQDIELLESTYNNNFHSTIKDTPIHFVSNKLNPPVWQSKNIPNYLMPKAYKFDFAKNKIEIDNKMENSLFKPLDTVRISTTRSKFGKSSVSLKWTDEIFLISSLHRPVLQFEPITYGLIDIRKQKIIGRFYSYELKKSSLTDEILINDIIKFENNFYYVNISNMPKSMVFKLNKEQLKMHNLSFNAKIAFQKMNLKK